MQKGILIKTGGHVLWKGDYACSLDYANTEVVRLQQKYPGLEVVLYEDSSAPEFVNAQVDMPGLIEVN